MLRRIVLVPLLLLLPSVHTQGEDDLYILLDEISVYSCRGVKNEIKLSENDVNIVNEKGNRVHFIKAPGNYSIHFKKIDVTKDFGYLSGELSVTLQVPVIEGPAGIRFDIPYPVIPETGLLDQRCDDHSGIVERDGRTYCRYCDMCGVSSDVERGLNAEGHQFLPALAAGQEEAFSPVCGHIDANSYEFKRTISLPGRRHLENLVKSKIQGVDSEIRKRLNKGRGRFQVYLNLISAKHKPLSKKAWFGGSSQCKCCGKDRDASCGSVLSFLYCNEEDCKSAWAQQCLHNSARIAACYTVEFNYRMTTNYNDVVQFLRENNYPNQDEGIGSAPQPSVVQPVPAPANHGVRGPGSISLRSRANQPEPGTAAAASTSSGTLSELCIAQMPQRLTHLRRYCTIFWNEKLCCQHCESVC